MLSCLNLSIRTQYHRLPKYNKWKNILQNILQNIFGLHTPAIYLSKLHFMFHCVQNVGLAGGVSCSLPRKS